MHKDATTFVPPSLLTVRQDKCAHRLAAKSVRSPFRFRVLGLGLGVIRTNRLAQRV